MLTRTLDAGVPAAWVTGDEVYDADPKLRAELESRGIGYALLRRVPARAWQCVSAGKGAKGHRLYDWAFIRLDNGQETTLDGRYLDHRPAWWTRGNLNRRTIDLGYASTGHRSQGITLDRALVRVAGAEDREWFYVAATRAARQQADRAADRQRQARRAQQEHLAYQERHPGLLAADRARTRELAWRSQVELRALELERPDWLRELSEPPATVKGRRAWRQAAVVILRYRERYGITDPDHALGPEPRHGNLEQRRHHRTARQAIERLHERQRTMRERRLGQHERSHADQPRTRPSRADQPRSVRADERQRGGREREAG